MVMKTEKGVDFNYEQKIKILFLLFVFRHGSQIRLQLSAASPTNRPQPKVIETIVIIKLKLWPPAGCEAKVAAELSSRPLFTRKMFYVF